MNIVDESTLTKLLIASHADADAASLRVVKWEIDDKVTKAGDNYTSQVYRLKVIYEKDDLLLSRAYFLKVPTHSPLFQIIKTIGGYDKEIITYTKILPHMYLIENDYFTPRLYYHDDVSKTLILKDLSQSGYKCVDRRQQLDFEHCYYALRCLAKLHGLSVAVDKSAETSYWLRHLPESSGDSNCHKSIMHRLPMFIDSLPQRIKDTYPVEVLAMQNLSWDRIVQDCFCDGQNCFQVSCHGDFWTNNIMFKYDTCGIVKKVKLLDFQFSRWANPALDIIYFTITSMPYDIYCKYFHVLVDAYVDALNKVLAKLGCAGYSTRELLDDIDQRYHYACLVISCVLPVTLADSEIPQDQECNNNNTKILPMAYKQQLYIDVSTKWFLHYIKKGVFNSEPQTVNLLKSTSSTTN